MSAVFIVAMSLGWAVWMLMWTLLELSVIPGIVE